MPCRNYNSQVVALSLQAQAIGFMAPTTAFGKPSTDTDTDGEAGQTMGKDFKGPAVGMEQSRYDRFKRCKVTSLYNAFQGKYSRSGLFPLLAI